MRIDLRTHGVSLSERQQEILHRRLHFALGRFADRIGRIGVWLTDENGPRGGSEHRCLLEVDLRPGSTVHAEAQGVDVQTAVASAGRRASRRVRDELARRRLFGSRPRAIVSLDEAVTTSTTGPGPDREGVTR